MRRSSLLPAEEEDFVNLVKEKTKHRDATQLLRYTPVEYKSYLRDVKTSAGSRSKNDSRGVCSSHRSRSIRDPRRSIKQIPPTPSHTEHLPRSNSYYYTNRCELLSLKEFNILVEQAQSEQKRQRQREQRASRKRLIAAIEDSIQPNNKVRLRLTSAVAQRMKNLIDP